MDIALFPAKFGSKECWLKVHFGKHQHGLEGDTFSICALFAERENMMCYYLCCHVVPLGFLTDALGFQFF